MSNPAVFNIVVCGNWAAHNQIPPGQTAANVLTVEDYLIQDGVKKVLEGTYPSGANAGWITVNLTEQQVKPDKENFEKIQTAYQVCMNQTALEAQGLKSLALFVNTVV